MEQSGKFEIEVGSLMISQKTKKVLEREGIKTVCDVVRLKESGLSRIIGIGGKGILNIRKELEKMEVYLLT